MHSTDPEAALPSPRVSPYPYAFDQVIEEENSVCSIQKRLLGGERTPSYEVLQQSLYLYEAQDRFELKVEILNKLSEV